MKVFIVTNIAFPKGMASTRRISSYAKAFRYANVECEVLIYRRTERYGIKPKNIESKGESDGVCFRYVSGTPQRGSTRIYRKICDLLDRLSLFNVIKSESVAGDVLLIYSHADSLFSALLCHYCHKKHIKCVKDLCELPYGTTKESLRNKLGRFIETRIALPLYDGLCPISDALVEYAEKYTSPRCQLLKVPILVDFEAFNLSDCSDNAPYPYIFHSGTLTEQKDGILGIVKAFSMAIKNTSIPIRLLCTGRENESREFIELKELIKQNHLEERVIFLGFLEEKELKKYLSEAGLVIINKYHTLQNRYCFSTKLGEYMAAGKPIIITKVGEAINWLADGKDAYIVEPENIIDLSTAIIQAFEHDDERKKIGEAARQTCKDSFDYKIYGSKLVSLIDSI